MTQIILTTDSAEEMKKLLSLARKSNLKFRYVAIKKKVTEYATLGKLPVEEAEDIALFNAIEEGRQSECVDAERFIKSLEIRCK
ncbi:MAG: hypothetical protein WC389_13195 [Lutibacter sp.]|jgi:hypothetical protein